MISLRLQRVGASNNIRRYMLISEIAEKQDAVIRFPVFPK